ncbi:hypothetical protein KUTeg_021192 [Tegillarca granosa]|uniref:Methyltransferase domain-containing protein n=1 Tax=Tegillarca granosa TaxID=220873 RepID=A0ABQ9EFJ1_TEGGR|nr:hypothetical protein KUTeg_021192 [Tegillarca granosa]
MNTLNKLYYTFKPLRYLGNFTNQNKILLKGIKSVIENYTVLTFDVNNKRSFKHHVKQMLKMEFNTCKRGNMAVLKDEYNLFYLFAQHLGIQLFIVILFNICNSYCIYPISFNKRYRTPWQKWNPNATIIDIDYADKSLRKAKLHAKNENLKNVEDYGHDVTSLPVEWTNTFDPVLMFDFLHDTSDPVKCVSEMKRVLMKDGLLIIADPNISSYQEKNEGNFLASAFYSISLFNCLPNSLCKKAENGLGIGWGFENEKDFLISQNLEILETYDFTINEHSVLFACKKIENESLQFEIGGAVKINDAYHEYMAGDVVKVTDVSRYKDTDTIQKQKLQLRNVNIIHIKEIKISYCKETSDSRYEFVLLHIKHDDNEKHFLCFSLILISWSSFKNILDTNYKCVNLMEFLNQNLSISGKAIFDNMQMSIRSIKTKFQE